MKIPFVDLNIQYLHLKSELDAAIFAVIQQSAFIGSSENPFIAKFESEFLSYLGIGHCISCANGTDSLEILLKAYGIAPGDEVIVPAFSWISTAEAVNNVGAKPVFVDILPGRYTINAEKIGEKISKRTKAIIPVHLYGLPCEMDEILSVANRYNLIVIEDCAQAHGAEYKGRKVGTIGHAASFSFYPGKNLGAYGDAGCMVTSDSSVAEVCRMISNHGQLRKHSHKVIGRNSRMDGLQAAVLSVKLRYLDQWNDLRRRNALLYKGSLSLLADKMQTAPEYSKHVYHILSVAVDNREKVISGLRDSNIQCAVHYPEALPFLEAYAYVGNTRNDFPVATDLAESTLSLPMYPELKESAIRQVCASIQAKV